MTVGSFNPSEQIYKHICARQNRIMKPQFFGVNIPKKFELPPPRSGGFLGEI